MVGRVPVTTRTFNGLAAAFRALVRVRSVCSKVQEPCNIIAPYMRLKRACNHHSSIRTLE
ncbi:MAG: hypothetical protein IJP44_05675 [Bacteroidales bacterium]|nr:hypothetical protein [Bacteroidales bacterium]